MKFEDKEIPWSRDKLILWENDTSDTSGIFLSRDEFHVSLDTERKRPFSRYSILNSWTWNPDGEVLVFEELTKW